MDALAYSYASQHLAEIIDRVNDNREPVLITQQNGKAVVILSLDDYNALEETAYLLRSPANAQRLMTSVEQLRQGKEIS